MTQVLYRKHRPKSFDEVFGQDHVVATLTNQLKNSRVAHAYLFAGPRGTGKTTVARILAKELSINEIDQIEIDAASNRGIDDIRALRESVNFQPAQGNKKIYVLDEVHMLTQEAFNALLKTLEEPPVFVHFVLCTTEVHKIPITVLSRCQRFSFELANEEKMEKYVRDLLAKEGVGADPVVVEKVVKESGGSYRDAVSTLQGVMGLLEKDSTSVDSILQGLGYGTEAEVKSLLNLVVRKDSVNFIKELNALISKGGEVSIILEQLVEKTRGLVLSGQTDRAVSNKVNANDLQRLLRRLIDIGPTLGSVSPTQLPIELAVLEWVQEDIAGQEPEVALKRVEDDGMSKGKMLSQTSVSHVDAQKTQNHSIPQSSVSTNIPWSKIMAKVGTLNHSLEALLKGGSPKELKENVLVLTFRYSFHKDKLEEEKNRRMVEEAVSEVLGKNVKIRCELGAQVQKEKGSSETEPKSNKTITHPSDQKTDEEDIMKLAQEVFGGELIE